MKDLDHWLDETSDADEFERSILRLGRSTEPPPGVEDAVWGRVLGAVSVVPAVAVSAGALPSSATVQSAVAGASKGLGVWLGVAKGFVVGLAIYGAAVGSREVVTRLASAPAPHASAAAKPVSRALVPAPRRAPAPVAGSSEPGPDSSLPLPPPGPLNGVQRRAAAPTALRGPAEPSSVATFPEPATEAPPSRLQAEAATLRSARAELRAGKLADAFATLEASRRQFPAPELFQEREALLVELLYRSGQVAAARERAEAFLAQFPQSPHAATIRRFARP